MNHFEAATATKQQKGIAKKEILLPTKRVIRISPPEVGDGGRRGQQGLTSTCEYFVLAHEQV
jgi:hypothetical protein